MMFDKTFKFMVTRKVYYIKDELNCDSNNILHLITCMVCLEQYAKSGIYFAWFTYIKTNKKLCGTVRHVNNKCSHSLNSFIYSRVQLIEKNSFTHDSSNTKGILWDIEKYWQSQFFTNIKDVNSVSDIYSSDRKGCRKN